MFLKQLVLLLFHFVWINFAQDPDEFTSIKLNTPQLILSRGFQYEEHSVITEDGYALTLFRVVNPCQKNPIKGFPILFWHQLTCSSDCYLISCPGFLDNNCIYSESNRTIVNNCGDSLTGNLVFTLSSCGYDVWLGNTRGNRYSQKHMSLSIWNTEFWDYTFTELGVYDVKNTIQYILTITKKPHVSYIGASMGSTIMFVLLSLEPDFEQYVRPFIAIPGVVFLSNTDSGTLRVLANYLAPIFDNFPITVGLGAPQRVAQLLGTVISKSTILTSITRELLYGLFGRNPYSVNPNLYPAIVSTLLNFKSSRLYLQYAQFIRDGRFHQFDYSNANKNYEYYGRPNAPDYPIEKITSKYIILYRGTRDALNTEKDHQKLLNKLTVKPMKDILIEFPFWNHIDHVYSCDTRFFLNKKILSDIRIINS